MANKTSNGTSGASVPTAMTVRQVSGRGSSPEKGWATAHSMVLDGPNGSELVFGRIDVSSHPAVGIEPILHGSPVNFDVCPICFDPKPYSREHVPPAALGGSVMTLTCTRCNNQFGTVVERDLVDWYEDAVGHVAFAHEAVRGERKSSRILQRQTNTGEFVLLLEGAIDSEIHKKLRPGGEFRLIYSRPDSNRYRLAALKSAYLGACVLLRAIPMTPEADAVRVELMAARDLPRRSRPVIGEQSDRIRIGRSGGVATPGEILLVRTKPTDGSEPEYAISLAGTLLVTWPVGGYLVATDESGCSNFLNLSGSTKLETT